MHDHTVAMPSPNARTRNHLPQIWTFHQLGETPPHHARLFLPPKSYAQAWRIWIKSFTGAWRAAIKVRYWLKGFDVLSFLKRHAEAIRALVSAAACVFIRWQIALSIRTDRDMAARETYREVLSISIRLRGRADMRG